ncbi:MAG: hypothetical protein ACLRMJ_06115 [Alistipes finegoldii]
MLAMHDTDYDLPKGGVTVRRAGMSTCSISTAPWRSWTPAMPMRRRPCRILERVSERWSPERYAERRGEFRAKWPPLWFSDISWRDWPKRRSLTSATS